jgi:FkbM family methyltransferase
MPINYFEQSEYLPHMYSDAQNYEDVTLRRALTDIKNGFWVDIGAHHPTFHSVTNWFHQNGWTGINVEPVPALFASFVTERPNDINIAGVIGATSGETTLFVFDESGLSTTSETLAGQHDAQRSQSKKLVVPMMTLDELLERHASGRTIDFLKIDAEDAEIDIIRAAEFIKFRPRIIVVENSGWPIYEPHLLSKDYLLVWYDGLNRWYVRREDESRGSVIARPPSIWDNFTKAESEIVSQLHSEIHAIKSSTSWGVTKPLRKLGELIR